MACQPTSPLDARFVPCSPELLVVPLKNRKESISRRQTRKKDSMAPAVVALRRSLFFRCGRSHKYILNGLQLTAVVAVDYYCCTCSRIRPQNTCAVDTKPKSWSNPGVTVDIFVPTIGCTKKFASMQREPFMPVFPWRASSR